ncbi:MAG TPA: amino acid adenylation domain-containing protein [Streptosporangiaceae bacterium]|nr:amino acid adenylation domain-containing protein [Streptosporangiaceae bacterium]
MAERAARVWAEVIGVDRVGPADNLFDFGVTSVTAATIVARLREEFGTALPLRTIFEHPTIDGLVPFLGAAIGPVGTPAEVPLRAQAATTSFPLSLDQERLWFLDQLQPGSAAYNIPVAATVTGALDAGVLGHCLSEVVRRHEALRTVFPVSDGRPLATVTPPHPLTFPVTDARAPTLAQARDRARACADEEAATPFDLARGPLLRARLVRVDEAEWRLLLTVHHIVADGWSIDLVFNELEVLYPAFAAGHPSPLPELTLRYADWATWQRDRLRGERLDSLVSWWRQRLAGAPPLLELPSDRPRPAIRSGRGAEHGFALPASLSAALRGFAQSESATLFMVTLAGFAALLHRYTGYPDMVVGTPVANRTQRDVEPLVGLFVQTVPLRCDLSGRPTFRELTRRVRETALDAFGHQDLPFGKLVEALRPERSLAYNPLVQAVFAFQNTHGGGAGGGRFRRDGGGATASGTAKFDLTLYLREHGDEIGGVWEYDTDLFDPDRLERMSRHLVNLLGAAMADPDRAVGALELTGAAERARLTPAPQRPRVEEALPALPELFADAVRRFGTRTAVADPARSLSYDELDRTANRLAHRLRKLGAGPETLVGVCVGRDVNVAVAILAVLKAGGAYLPLDPTYPPERLQFTLADAGCRLVVGAAEFRDLLTGYGGAYLALDTDASLGDEPDDAPAAGIHPDNAAYVIYTSGSTGRPKGVVVSHANVTRLFRVTTPGYGFCPDDTWALFHSFGFDFSVWELWGALLHGGRLVVVPWGVSRDPEAFLRLLTAERVTVLSQTPSAFRQLATAAESAGFPATSLRLVVFGGEALDPRALRAWFAHYGDARPRLVNMYGITETTVHVTERALATDDTELADSPVGRPLDDLWVYLLDPDMEPVGTGVIGEMYVGGAGVSRGYLRRPGLTAQRFCPDPFGPPGSRLYRTGDLAFRRAGSELVFCGRADSQVQLRGFRIELGEIEHTLLDQPRVREAAVVLRDGVAGEQRLVGYVVPAPGAAPGHDELRSGLARRLPSHMVPSSFVVLDRFPLTTNGKLDRAELPAPEGANTATAGDYTPPRTPAEQRVADAWAQVLGVGPVGAYHNFFELGGHSLLVPPLAARLSEEFGRALAARLVFEHPTVAGLAAAIVGQDRPGVASVSSVDDWLLGHRPSGRATTRLLCFPFAGGGASLYRGWRARLPAEVDLCAVQLPGRQTRLSEPPSAELPALVEAVSTALWPLADLPWVLFGHSFGGLVAFELAQLLAERGHPPAHLFVSALRPPHLLGARDGDRERSDTELVAKLRQPGGLVADEVSHQDVLDFALPAFRADVSMLDRYIFQPRPPLEVPLSVFGGAEDTHPAPDELAAWQRHTRGPFRARVVPGGHFFLAGQEASLCGALVSDLREGGLVTTERHEPEEAQ